MEIIRVGTARIVFDNIIFSLQRTGGISVVWFELLSRFLRDRPQEGRFLEYAGACLNIFRKQLAIDERQLVRKRSALLFLRRYFNPGYQSGAPFIFHSSYYRTCRNKKAVNVTTVHDFTYEYYCSGLTKFVHCRQKYRAIRHSDYIICISENTRKDLLKFCPGIDDKKIRVIYNGVSGAYRVLKDKVPENCKLPFPANTYVLFVGDRSAYKNFGLTVEAVAESSLNLVIVGSELTRAEHEMLGKHLDACRYHSTGRISNELLNVLYNNAYCLLYPSAYEGFGIPVLEAQRAGCPVIAYNGSSIPEIIGETPLLLSELSVCAIGKALQILQDPDSRAEIVRNGLENVKRFDWKHTYEQTMSLYKEIMPI